MQISVRAEHSLRLAPERATVWLSLQHTSSDKQDALRVTQRTAADLVAELHRLEAAEGQPLSQWSMEHVRTSTYQPTDNKGRRLPAEFTAIVGAHATFADFSQMSEFIATWGVLQGLRIDSVSWDLLPATRQAKTAEVLTGAVIAARERAEAIAQAAGLQSVAFAAVEDEDTGQVVAGSGGMGMMRSAVMSAAQSAPALEFQPEDITISESIIARFDAS